MKKSKGGMRMLQHNTYKVIREYNNRYELEELLRRIIRHHIKEIHSGQLIQGNLNDGVTGHAKRFGG